MLACGFDTNCAALVVRKVITDYGCYYELWEGYHRVTVMRKLAKQGMKFPLIKFIHCSHNCDEDQLYNYCFGNYLFNFSYLY